MQKFANFNFGNFQDLISGDLINSFFGITLLDNISKSFNLDQQIEKIRKELVFSAKSVTLWGFYIPELEKF